MVDRDARRNRKVVRHPAPEPGPDRPFDFPTEALLDGQAGAADELRADLDRLRRQLEDGPPPLSPVRRRHRKPLLAGLVLAVGLTIAAALLVGRPGWPDSRGDGTRPSDPSRRTATTATAAAAAPRPAPPGSLPGTGPGIDEPGTMMVVQVARSGSLDVTEQAVLGPRELQEIGLRLPSMASLGGQVAELTPTVDDLRVAVNRVPVSAVPTADGRGWAVATTAAGAPARTVELSYRIRDAVVRTAGSRSGRALGVSLPLLGQALREQGLPLVVRAEGAAVGGVTCPGAPTTQMLCGRPDGDGWLAVIPAEATSPTLLLQLTLA